MLFLPVLSQHLLHLVLSVIISVFVCFSCKRFCCQAPLRARLFYFYRNIFYQSV